MARAATPFDFLCILYFDDFYNIDVFQILLFFLSPTLATPPPLTFSYCKAHLAHPPTNGHLEPILAVPLGGSLEWNVEGNSKAKYKINCEVFFQIPPCPYFCTMVVWSRPGGGVHFLNFQVIIISIFF